MEVSTELEDCKLSKETVEIQEGWSDSFAYWTLVNPVETSVWSAECQFGHSTFDRGTWQAIAKTKEGATGAIASYLRACKAKHLEHPSHPNPSDWLRVEIAETRLLD